MRKLLLSCILSLFFVSISFAADGIITIKNAFDVPTTANRHGITNREKIVKKIEKSLANFAKKATAIE